MSTTAQELGPGQGAPSPAVAPPPGSPRYPLLDAMRGLAVLVVIAFHVSSITGALATRAFGDMLAVLGNVAIVMFFLMSSFLLYRPFVAAHAAGRVKPSGRRFLERRALRVLPGYWVALTVLALFPGIVGVFSGDWWRYYFFAQTYSTESFGRGIPPAWTLCVEVIFYLMVPVWAWAVRGLPAGRGRHAWLRAELGAVAVLAAAGVVAQVLTRQLDVSQLVGDSIFGQAVWISLGMGLAAVTVALQHGAREPLPVRVAAAHPGACWTAALIPWIVLAIVQHRPGGLLGIVAALNTPQPVAKTLLTVALTSLMALLLVAPALFGAHRGGPLRRALSAAPLMWLGLVSYALYLYHLTVAEMLGVKSDPQHFSESGLGLVDHLPHLTTPALFVLTTAVSAALAALSYYFVELPFLKRKAKVR